MDITEKTMVSISISRTRSIVFDVDNQSCHETGVYPNEEPTRSGENRVIRIKAPSMHRGFSRHKRDVDRN